MNAVREAIYPASGGTAVVPTPPLPTKAWELQVWAINILAREVGLWPSTRHEPLLRDLGTSSLRLRLPLGLELTQQEGSWAAECPELNEYGVGPTREAAIADLQATIIELYEQLQTEQQRLGPDLRELWSILLDRVEAP